VASLTVCANERWTGADGEQKERQNWVKVELWGPRAEGLAPHTRQR
jgi:single-stranded DNA-binding protein